LVSQNFEVLTKSVLSFFILLRMFIQALSKPQHYNLFKIIENKIFLFLEFIIG